MLLYLPEKMKLFEEFSSIHHGTFAPSELPKPSIVWLGNGNGDWDSESINNFCLMLMISFY